MRRHDRRPAELVVTVRTPRGAAGASIHLDSCNISEGGAFLRSDLLFEIGETLDLKIPLPSGLVKAAGRVVRVARPRDPAAIPGMGIEFTGLSAQDRQAIATDIRMHLQSAPAPSSA